MKYVLFIKDKHRVELRHLQYEHSGMMLKKLFDSLRKGEYVNVACAVDSVTPSQLVSLLTNGVNQSKWNAGSDVGSYFPCESQKSETGRSIQGGDVIVDDKGQLLVDLHVVVPTGLRTVTVERTLIDLLLATD